MLRFILLVSPLFVCACTFAATTADEVVWYEKGIKAVSCNVRGTHDDVVEVALTMFGSDMKAVTGETAMLTAQSTAKGNRATIQIAKDNRATIQIVQADRAKAAEIKRLRALGIDTDKLLTATDAFVLKTAGEKIIVAGGNGRGTAYAILELSRLAGVSPWIWWGDCQPERRERLTLPADYENYQCASVEMRGVFLNDEDWSLRPWGSSTTDNKHFRIEEQTYKRVFELLLRLRANTLWPAMHEGTEAFFKNPRNKMQADRYAIFIGTSHCEPLLRNNVDEWDAQQRGDFNYISNKEAVQQYWAERLEEVKHSQTNIFTIGMRGIHDSSMLGVKSMQEKFDALQRVINDQQTLIATHIGAPEKQKQVFVPYKEVLELYQRGLQVPDYVTLMWCDDNYGYLTHLSNEEEQKRSGGAGVYYHLSYWGRPHDYLWLTTTSPGLIYKEMKNAYDHHARKLWIANVHDLKVAGYDLELFLDMAWNINSVNGETLTDHYKAWLCRQFGQKAGEQLLPAMLEFWKLTAMRKPEFMGWNQNELDKRVYPRGLSPVQDTEFSFNEFGSEADRYLESYKNIAKAVEEIGEKYVSKELAAAYFAAITYPVKGSCLMAVKTLEAQRARCMHTAISAARSKTAHAEIQSMTKTYNEMLNGKWNKLMDMQPRKQLVFEPPTLPEPEELTAALPPQMANLPYDEHATPISFTTDTSVIAYNANDYCNIVGESKGVESKGVESIALLGHSQYAVSLPKGCSLVYRFRAERDGEALLKTALIPTQPTDGGELRYGVSIDGGEETMYSLKEPFRSEQWKQNVLRGQAVRQTRLHLTKGIHTLTIRAIDHHIILDQWMIDFNLERKHYLFPVTRRF